MQPARHSLWGHYLYPIMLCTIMVHSAGHTQHMAVYARRDFLPFLQHSMHGQTKRIAQLRWQVLKGPMPFSVLQQGHIRPCKVCNACTAVQCNMLLASVFRHARAVTATRLPSARMHLGDKDCNSCVYQSFSTLSDHFSPGADEETPG
jgi:hypothetical protein